MRIEEWFPKSCCCCSSYFIFCGVSQYVDLLWLSVRLVLRMGKMIGFQTLKLFFLFLPFQAKYSVSRILSQQAAARDVAQGVLLVCALIEILPVNFVMLPVWILGLFDGTAQQTALWQTYFFFPRVTSIPDVCTENGRSSAWVSCSLFFTQYSL